MPRCILFCAKRKTSVQIFLNLKNHTLVLLLGMPLRGSHRFFETLREKGFSLRSKKLFKINDGMGCNCLSAAPMLFWLSVISSKLGSPTLKPSCIIFSMMLHPKPSQKIIQGYATPKWCKKDDGWGMMEKDHFIPIEEKGEIVLYQPDDNVRLEVRLQDDTVWLTQQQMTELFKMSFPIL